MGERIRLTSEDRVRVARESLPAMKSIGDDLLPLAERFLSEPHSYDAANGADVMARSFTLKQSEHLRSLRLLLDANAHRDAVLIGRTMLEGEVILRWAFRDVPERTDQWFWFGAIADWRQLLENEADGEAVDQEEKSELRRYADLHGHRYLRRKVREANEKASSSGALYTMPVDPWSTRWTEVSVDAMAKEIDFGGLYDSFYRSSSGWVHWAIRSILLAQDNTESGTTTFSPASFRTASQALAAGCQALLSSLEIMNDHFELSGSTEVESLRTRLVKALNDLLIEASKR